MIYEDLLDLVGNTPVVKFPLENDNVLYLKLEMFNPTGSIKDRVAKQMILDLKNEGKINDETKIIEATSGNTGIGLAFVLGSMGLHPYIFLPSTMSKERMDLLEAYGAILILTPGKEGMKGATTRAEAFAKEHNGIYVNQFINNSNIVAHENTTAKEIINDIPDLDYLVAGIGTSGTIVGLAHVLKNHYDNLKIIGVEPQESAVLNGKLPNPHGIQGIGAGFVPPLFQKDLVDEIVTISTNRANDIAKYLGVKGLFLGISSCAAIAAAYDISKSCKNKKILAICPDGGNKYLSLGVYNHVERE